MRETLFGLIARRDTESEPDHIAIAHRETSYRVRLKRSARARRISLRVSQASGEVVLSMPEGVSLDRAVAFARAHGGWIASRVARLPDRVALEHGAPVPLRDVPHRIVHWSRVRGPTRVTHDAAGQAIIAVSGPQEFVAKRVREFLQREARADLTDAVARYTAALGRPARRINLRDTRSRWGSCTARGDLSFSWRLILAPPMVLDYLAAHEVAHLAEMNHSPRYWAILRDICPHTDQAEAWLKRHGSGLHRYA
ncbi:MAG: M48 family metallopeptidase [Salinarimonas sp.]|nr:M48 family metallopeptidase [Salinarimonas sp.]